MLTALTDAPIDQGNAHFQPSNLQISTIDIGNPTTNIIPGKAQAVFNIRFNDGWTCDTLKTWLQQKLDAVGGRYELAIKVSGESFLTPAGEVSDTLDRRDRARDRPPARAQHHRRHLGCALHLSRLPGRRAGTRRPHHAQGG